MLLKKTVDGILGGLAKMEKQLRDLAVTKGNEVALIADKVEVLENSASEARGERDHAMRVANKLHDITS